MVSRFALLAVAAAFIAYSPMVALGCSGSSAQLSDGTKVAQGYGSPSPTQSMPDQNAQQSTDQGGSSSTTDPGSTEDK